MKKNLQKIYDYKALGVFVVIALLFFGSTRVNAQFSATWPFTSGLSSNVTGASSGNLTASAATYTSGTGGLFTGVVTTSTGFLNGTGISGRASTSCSTSYNAVSTATPYLEYKIAPNAGYSMTTNSFTFTVESTTFISNILVAAGYSVDGGVTFINLAAPTTPGTGVPAISPTGSNYGSATTGTASNAGTFTFTVPAATIAALNSLVLRVVVWRNNASASTGTNLRISSPVITGTTPVSLTPAISSGTPFTAFTYVSGSGPSTSQSSIITGSNLNGPITIDTDTLTNFEVSLDNFATAAATGILTVPSGTAISVRLKTGLSVGSYSDTVSIQSVSDSYTLPLSCSGTVTPLYVYSGIGLLSDTANWSPAPPNFTAANATYSIPSSATTDFNWALGSGSKIIVGDGISAANLTIDPSFFISGGSINVSAGATLTVAHLTSPTLGTLNATSTVEYTAATAAVPSSKTFGNLKVTGVGSIATQASGVTTVAGNFTLSNGSIYRISNASSGSILSTGGDFNVSGAGGITTTSILAAATSAALTLTGTGKNIDNTASANDFVKLNVNINGTYSLANDFKYNTTLASARLFTIGASGSLNLNGKKLSLDNNGAVSITLGGTFTANGLGSTVEFFGAPAQAIPTTILYHNLILSGGSKTIPAGLSIANDLTLDGPTDALAAGDLVVNNNLTVGLLGSVTVSAGKNLTVNNALINNATAGAAAVVVESGANLIQGSATTVNSNTGNITVKRNSNGLHRLDFSLWSSPVAGAQTLADFSPLTSQSPNRFFTFDPSGNQYVATAFASPFLSGTGYLIRMPNTDPTTNYDAGTAPLSFLGVFAGKPNNGNFVITTVPNKYNSLGNLYPSVIDADLFKASNPDINTLYYWRKTNNPNQGTSPTTSYASYNIASATGIGVAPDGVALGEPTITPDKYIQVGQGFIFETAQTSVAFNNGMRVANIGNKFLKTKQIERSRIWLNLSNASWPINQMALCYMDGALVGLDETDSKYINDSPVALTSNIDNGEYTIQGRPKFDATDVVALNFKTDLAGDYNIALDHFDGLFASGQDVYLLDSTTGTETDLKASTYTFTAKAGLDSTRFSLKYQKTLKVDAPAFNENSVSVYKKNGTLFINSEARLIHNIKVFDIQGRLLAEQKNVKANTATIKDLKAIRQVLIIKILGEDGNIVTKKVAN
jgi:trimeric autotransporter adhesin